MSGYIYRNQNELIKALIEQNPRREYRNTHYEIRRFHKKSMWNYLVKFRTGKKNQLDSE